MKNWTIFPNASDRINFIQSQLYSTLQMVWFFSQKQIAITNKCQIVENCHTAKAVFRLSLRIVIDLAKVSAYVK